MGGRVNSVPARQASTGELLSPSHVHKPSKHKPASFFPLNPEVILRSDPLGHNSGFFSQSGYQQNTVKLEGLCFFYFFLLSDSILHAFKASFYTSLPLFFASKLPKPQTLPPNTTREAVKMQELTPVVPNIGSRGFQGDLGLILAQPQPKIKFVIIVRGVTWQKIKKKGKTYII